MAARRGRVRNEVARLNHQLKVKEFLMLSASRSTAVTYFLSFLVTYAVMLSLLAPFATKQVKASAGATPQAEGIPSKANVNTASQGTNRRERDCWCVFARAFPNRIKRPQLPHIQPQKNTVARRVGNRKAGTDCRTGCGDGSPATASQSSGGIC